MEDILKNIDGKATQKAVEAVLRQYRTYLVSTPEELMPVLTAKYNIEIPNFSNIKQSSVENAAVKRADFVQEYIKFYNWFKRGISKLTLIERHLISMAYLEIEPMYNYEIYLELGISESKFYRLRGRALYKLSIGLGVEIYEKHEVVNK